MPDEQNEQGQPQPVRPKRAPEQPKQDIAERMERSHRHDSERSHERQEAPPRGHPGGILRHVIDLARSLRARDWSAAWGHFIDLGQLVKDDLDGLAPAPMFAANVAAGADQLAERLERFASDHGSLRGDERGAFPWGELLPLLKMLVDVILSKRT